MCMACCMNSSNESVSGVCLYFLNDFFLLFLLFEFIFLIQNNFDGSAAKAFKFF
jgi:hypothetical protein